MIDNLYVEKALSYGAYEQLIADLLAGGRTTGPDQSEAFIHYTQLNQQRMHRLDKTTLLLPSVETSIKGIVIAPDLAGIDGSLVRGCRAKSSRDECDGRAESADHASPAVTR